MKITDEFPFERARRITAKEVKEYRKAIEKKIGIKRPIRLGRPPKKAEDKFKPVYIRINPEVLKKIKIKAKKRSLPYQTLINEILKKYAA